MSQRHEPEMNVAPTLTATVIIPEQVTATAFSSDGSSLAVGADDGSVRFYNPPETKVTKAIRGLGSSVSGVVFHGEDNSNCWVAAGRDLYRFSLTRSTLILTRADAILVKQVGESDDDTLNEIALSANRATLACTSDSGSVWVLDVASGAVSKMRTSHSSIAWTVAFIPDRPSELLSGGYDCALLHHDFKQGTVLSRLEIPHAPPLAPGISSLPPFITATALSPAGAVAAGTADGRIWVGRGGEKAWVRDSGPEKTKSKEKTKKSRKWRGLDVGEATKVGEGLVTALTFITPDRLIACTLHGVLGAHRLVRASESNIPSPDTDAVSKEGSEGADTVINTLWSVQSAGCAKVDVLAFHPSHQIQPPDPQHGGDKGTSWLALGGLHKDAKRGCLELYALHTGAFQSNSSEHGVEIS